MATILCFTPLFFLCFLYPSPVFTDLSSDRAALLGLRSAVGLHSMQWSITDMKNPCSWPGVICSDDFSSVIELHLPGMGLSGVIPTNTISNLTGLQTLSLRYNSLSGPFPVDISSLVNLRNLYLQSNQFSGPIPEFVFSLSNLVRLNLADNQFSGNISPSFENMTRLGTLYLENNDFSGAIPDWNLPGLVQFNVSNNRLSGMIPKGIANKYSISAFSGNSLCGQPLNDLCDNGVGSGKKKKGLSDVAIAGIVIGCVVGTLILAMIVLFMYRKRGEKKERSYEGGSRVGVPNEKSFSSEEKGGFAVIGTAAKRSLVFVGKTDRVFNLEELLRASAEVLGKGTSGTTYKAGLDVGVSVAVKRLKDLCVNEKVFREKMDEIGGMRHENLVPLIAYYYNKEEKLLVYDYLPMGSLSALLHGNKGDTGTPLTWESRIAIALGAAKGISYLHSKSPTFSHGNIKSSNILLTKTYEPRVSDFGLARLIDPSAGPKFRNACGYKAPEVTDHRKVSQKADVYSFGVLLLELLTGKAPTNSVLNEEGFDLPRWVQSIVREEWTAEVFDLELLTYEVVEEELVQLLQLAVDCTMHYPDERPAIDEVVARIQELHESSS